MSNVVMGCVFRVTNDFRRVCKVEKSTVAFVMYVCFPSVCQRRTTCSQLTDFCEILNLGVLLKSVEKIKVWLKLYKNNRYFT
jgi:hypothetical protein